MLAVAVTGLLSLGGAVVAPAAANAVDFAEAPVPKIEGLLQVGQTLTATGAEASVWTPAATTVTYQWFRGDTSETIPGATVSTYTLTPADLGKRISVEAYAVRDPGGYAQTTRSAYSAVVTDPSAPVTPKPKVKVGTPKITGAKRVGKLLRATATRTSGATLTAKWYRNGKQIGGTKGALTYRLTARDLGKRISVKVTAKKAGYLSAVSKSSAKTKKITKGHFAHPKPRITGTKQVGKILTASPAKTWGTTNLKYHWYDASGKLVKVSKSPHLKVTAKMAGKKIRVKVYGSKRGYHKVKPRWSSTTSRIAKGHISGSKPKIAGAAKTGSTLTAKHDWAVKPSFQWYVAGSKVSGATGKTYKVRASDQGKSVKVRLVASKRGYKVKTSTSSAVRVESSGDNGGCPPGSVPIQNGPYGTTCMTNHPGGDIDW